MVLETRHAGAGVAGTAPFENWLKSWKEVAAYFKRDVTTVRRWERLEGLPVHRLYHRKLANVYAYASELQAWRDARRRREKPRTAGGPHVRSLAVLPLLNLAPGPQQQYFAVGLTEALITELSARSRLRVISRTSVMQFKGERPPVREIARALDVVAVVEGTVLHSDSRVRITAQLVDGDTGLNIWARAYERDLADVLVLQRDMARVIARHIDLATAPARMTGSQPRDLRSPAGKLLMERRAPRHSGRGARMQRTALG